MSDDLRNWAGNYEYTAAGIHRPTTVEQVQEIVAGPGRFKALGTRHSFNDIADTDGKQISTEFLNHILSLDRTASTVTVQAGIPYGRLCTYLYREGFALHNLASLPHISIAGACATATHGSGDRNGNLATAVRSLEIVKANGEAVRLTRGVDEDFEGAVVNLGALGLVTEMTLDVSPNFDVSQEVFENLPLGVLESHLDEVTSAAYSVSLFTDWSGPAINQVWLKRVGDEPSGQGDFFGALRAREHMHPIAGVSAENCTPQLGLAGPWHERLPHFKMDFTPSNGDELQSEYLVPRERAFEAISEVSRLSDRISPLLHISEIRTIAADELWMSPCYRQPCVGVHFTWKPVWDEVGALLPEIEARLWPLGARPHWGKLSLTGGEQLAAAYPRVTDFAALCEKFDPERRFRNAYLERLLPS